ncbi:hypothetical protein [Methylobacterium indicum]|uniref:hypothetical protein n=1 Tax=Methylobacterium indicum TaxID=1775910 RepID=UPI000B0BE699|nr:hypothetical protein [Methylobacterium indicum]
MSNSLKDIEVKLDKELKSMNKAENWALHAMNEDKTGSAHYARVEAQNAQKEIEADQRLLKQMG